MNSSRRIAALASTLACLACSCGAVYAGDPVLPPGFAVTQVVSGITKPVDIVFADDGRIFVTEMRGTVQVIENGVMRPDPFIDLTAEVNARGERGLLGLALDPDFLSNRKVYLLYTVDPIFGIPDEDPSEGTFGRLTCYTGTEESDGNIADLGSRCVLIGETWSEGIPVCDISHTIGTVQFGLDGSLFVGAGDGARLGAPDAGGLDPECFGVGKFGEDQDIGSFRAQYLDSLAGKILRVDPATGLGLPTNPHWTGDGADNRSRVWVNGLRNPYRFALRPAGAGPGPGTLYVGDVGRGGYEEVDVAYGGENFGWPCREGLRAAPVFPEPAHSGCDSIETKSNPGPLTDPILDMHHTDESQSDPPGAVSRCIIGGVFYEGTCYPELYRGAYFYMDQRLNWIRVAEVDEQNNLIATHVFAENLIALVDIASDPLTGDLFLAAYADDRILRIRHSGPGCPKSDCPGDFDGNRVVDFADLLGILAGWGPCGVCPEDLDGSGVVDFGDILIVLASWGPCPP